MILSDAHHNMSRETTFKYIGLAAIILLLIGLAGWYFFISRQSADLNAADAGRGFDIGVPSFAGSRGSTAENIASGFGAAPRAQSEEESKRPPRLWRVNASPVAGAAFVTNNSTVLLRFVERSTGHIFDADPMTGVVTRRTNRLIPKVYEASVRDDAVILRTIAESGERETFVGTLGTTTVDGFTPLTGTDLGADVRDIVFEKNGILFFSAAPGADMQLVRSALDGSKPSVVRTFAAGDFLLSVLSDARVIITEKAASGITGHAYEVGNSLLPLARPTLGLTALARASSTAVIIGSDTGSSLSLSVRPTKDATPIMLDINTVAEKCVWAPGLGLTAYCAVPQEVPALGFLTNWYRGVVHTTDSWHTIDASAGESKIFFEIRENDAIDVERPMIDVGANYILFTNARDKSLWLLRIIE